MVNPDNCFQEERLAGAAGSSVRPWWEHRLPLHTDEDSRQCPENLLAAEFSQGWTNPHQVKILPLPLPHQLAFPSPTSFLFCEVRLVVYTSQQCSWRNGQLFPLPLNIDPRLSRWKTGKKVESMYQLALALNYWLHRHTMTFQCFPESRTREDLRTEMKRWGETATAQV